MAGHNDAKILEDQGPTEDGGNSGNIEVQMNEEVCDVKLYKKPIKVKNMEFNARSVSDFSKKVLLSDMLVTHNIEIGLI